MHSDCYSQEILQSAQQIHHWQFYLRHGQYAFAEPMPDKTARFPFETCASRFWNWCQFHLPMCLNLLTDRAYLIVLGKYSLSVCLVATEFEWATDWLYEFHQKLKSGWCFKKYAEKNNMAFDKIEV